MTDNENKILEAAKEASKGTWRRGETRTYGIYAESQRGLIASVNHWEGDLVPMNNESDANADYIVAAQPQIVTQIIQDKKELEEVLRSLLQNCVSPEWPESVARTYDEIVARAEKILMK